MREFTGSSSTKGVVHVVDDAPVVDPGIVDPAVVDPAVVDPAVLNPTLPLAKPMRIQH